MPLTLNIGLRWEFATPRWERDNNLSNFDPALNKIIRAPGGDLYGRALVDPDYRNFGPRVAQFVCKLYLKSYPWSRMYSATQ